MYVVSHTNDNILPGSCWIFKWKVCIFISYIYLFFWLNLKQTFSRNVYFMFANLTYLLLYLWFQCIYIALLPPFYWLLAVRKSAVFQTKGNIKNLGTYIFLVDRLMRNPVNEICVSYWYKDNDSPEDNNSPEMKFLPNWMYSIRCKWPNSFVNTLTD